MALNFQDSPTVGQEFKPGPGNWKLGATGRWDRTNYEALFRNRLVNGSMLVSQENGTAAVTANNGFPADQWQITWSGIPLQAALTTNNQTPSGIRNVPTFNHVSAKAYLAASDWGILQQILEGARIADFNWGAAQAIPAVIRFSAKADTPGLYSLAIRNAAATHSFICGIAMMAAQ